MVTYTNLYKLRTSKLEVLYSRLCCIVRQTVFVVYNRAIALCAFDAN